MDHRESWSCSYSHQQRWSNQANNSDKYHIWWFIVVQMLLIFFADGSTEAWRRIFDVNVMGLCICTREAIKVMKENGIDGHIVHINSIAGHYVPQLPKPVLNVYPASKFAVTALTETLIHELRSEGSRIKVTVSMYVMLLLSQQFVQTTITQM